MHSKYHVLFILFIAVISGCTGKKGPSPSEQGYFPVKEGAFEGTLTWRGIIRSANRIEIKTDKAIKVSKIVVKNDDKVKKGQLLIEVDTTEVTAKLNEATARLATATLELESSEIKVKHTEKISERKQALEAKGIIPKKEGEEALRDMKLANTEFKAKTLEKTKIEHEIEQLKEQLKISHFYSPMDGTISELVTDLQPGTDLQAAQPIGVVSDPSKLALWVPVEETEIHRIHVGDSSTVTLDAFPGDTFSGKILEKSLNAPAGRPQRVKTFEVSIGFDVKQKQIQEGFGGEANITYAHKENALTIPLSAVRYMDGRDFALVSKNAFGAGEMRKLELGLKTESEVEIVSGLNKKEYVIVEASTDSK